MIKISFTEFNAKFEELVTDEDKYEAEFAEALSYQEKICNAVCRVRLSLHSGADIGSLPTATSTLP